MRYAGQGYEIAVDITALERLDEATLREGFEAAYKTLYGRTIPGMQVEILSWTLSLTAPQDFRADHLSCENDQNSLPVGTTDLFNGSIQVPALVLPRAQLQPGEQHQGPLLVIEAQTTTVVPQAAHLEVLTDGTLRITLDEPA
jgi:N-methylhydantoinase A